MKRGLPYMGKEAQKVSDARIRPVPGFDRIFAGDDGNLYRRLEGHKLRGRNRFRYVTLRTPDGGKEERPIAAYIAMAWLGLSPEKRGARFEARNGDASDATPGNIVVIERARYTKAETSARSREKRSADMEADPEDPRHGTFTGYNCGCKCERCRALGSVVHRRNELRKTMREGGLL